MTKRAILLRGVNVGGHRKVPMAELRAALDGVGFDSVETYIRSGNVVVSGGPDDAATAAAVERVLATDFGVADVPIVIRDPVELEHARQRSAELFPAVDGDDDHDTFTHVVFLAERPHPVRRASLDPAEFAPDLLQLDIHGSCADLHVRYAAGQSMSKLTIDRIERAYGVRATARNLKTVGRLHAMTTGADSA